MWVVEMFLARINKLTNLFTGKQKIVVVWKPARLTI